MLRYEKPVYEQGYVLVTALILLSILTILGVASTYKSIVEIKVSTLSADTAKASQAADAGLNQLYWYWYNQQGTTGDPGWQEVSDLIAYIGNATGTVPAPFNQGLVGESIDAIDNAVGGLDVYIQAGNNVRVYQYQKTGQIITGLSPVLNSNWGLGTLPQVAVWVAAYAPQGADTYPYATPSVAASSELAVYALGRSGGARKLVREFMTAKQTTIKVYGAMVNAPKFADNTDRCATPPVTSTASTTASAVPSASTGTQSSHMIDATQAPGGIAVASNNGVNWPSGSKQWGNNGGTGSSAQDIDPWVMYDPEKSAYAAAYATSIAAGNTVTAAKTAGSVAATAVQEQIAGDWVSNVSATVVSQNLFTNPSGYIDYFDSVNSQVFQLDAYREAANRIAGFSGETFTYTNPDGTTVTQTITLTGAQLNGLGNYSTLTTVVGGNTYHRMGTLQWPEITYNIDHNIPMYGLVRLLVPVLANGTATDCGVSIAAFSPAHDPLSSATDPLGKLIVYGGALFDFFYDANGDDIYDPSSERLLTQGESLTFKVNVDTPLAFNPVMDGVSPRTGATATSTDYTQIDNYPNGSPSWNLATDAMPSGDGAMDLIWDVWNIGKQWFSQVHNGTSYVGFGGDYKNWMTQESPAVAAPRTWSLAQKNDLRSMLDYYIRTTSMGSKPVWSDKTAAAIEGNYTQFRITTQTDVIDTPSSADLYHTFLPNGYTHGWKRAMMETGLAAQGSVTGKSIWNEDLLPSGSFFHAKRKTYFNLAGLGNSARIDKDFADIPAEMYAGGLVDMHQAVNTSGVVYTPGQLELEQKNIIMPALQYINGIIITGYGTFMKNEAGANARTVIAYDDTSIDNLPTQKETLASTRHSWQELK